MSYGTCKSKQRFISSVGNMSTDLVQSITYYKTHVSDSNVTEVAIAKM